MDFPKEWNEGIPEAPELYRPRQPREDESVRTLDEIKPGDIILAQDYFRRHDPATAHQEVKGGIPPETAYWARLLGKTPVGAVDLVWLRLLLANGKTYVWSVHSDYRWLTKEPRTLQ